MYQKGYFGIIMHMYSIKKGMVFWANTIQKSRFFAKVVLIFGMWFGRLELFVVLALFSRGIPSFIREAYSERKKAEPGRREDDADGWGGVIVQN